MPLLHFADLRCVVPSSANWSNTIYTTKWASPVAQWSRIHLPMQGAAGDACLIPGLGRSPGEGNDHPLQYSCLENPMDKGALWATVHWVTRVGHDWSDLLCKLALCTQRDGRCAESCTHFPRGHYPPTASSLLALTDIGPEYIKLFKMSAHLKRSSIFQTYFNIPRGQINY